MRTAAVHAAVLTWRNLVQIPRSPHLVVTMTVQPIMFTLLFAFVFGGAITTPEVDYIDFLVPGIVAQTIAFGTTSTAVGLNEDLRRGIIDRFRSMPIARGAILTGRVLADSGRMVLTVVVAVTVGLLLGFDFRAGAGRALAFVALALLIGIALSWIAVVVGLSVASSEAAQSVGFMWLFPLTFASSAFVPIGTMPDGLRAFAQVNPFTAFVDGLRNLALGGALDSVWWSVVWAVAITGVAAPIAIVKYSRMR
ncbi:MAG: ABC transporter [Micrococcales bacterium]|nr:MAG: ABC transporter [Micrococcales bacterium]PIE25833.1 MAG: ABC transporter [Micrococcales bacterium]